MTMFYCECDSLCTLRSEVSDDIFKRYPQLFEVDSYQFIVAGCHIGADARMSLEYMEEGFQIYKEN